MALLPGEGLGVTVCVTGFAAYMTGQAVANSWKPAWHALAYALLAFFSITLSRRILWFGPWYQALHVAPLLLLAEAVVLLVRLANGAAPPGWPIFVGPLIGAALWPLLSWLLLLRQRRALEAGSL